MKKVIFPGMALLLFATMTHAQSKSGADYFAGTWNILLKGTPNGDAKMIFVLDKKDTAMTGVVQDSTGKEMSKIEKTELKADTITVYFTAQGYDVTVTINKKDDDHVIGSLMGMFDVEGDRVKKPK
jgi:TPP-dependent indolepyruvate ferredoxin oxidoreductase alpha subunit